jgi:hypothetical protein
MIYQHKKTKASFAPYMVIAAGIIPPSAYLLGYAFYEGYLHAFGVATDGFPVSTPNVYVYSYQAVGFFLLGISDVVAKTLIKLMSPPSVFGIIGILFLVIGGIYWLLKTAQKEPHPGLRRRLERIKDVFSWLHWENNDFTKSVGIVGVASYSILSLATALMSVAIFWWYLPLSASAKGKEVATNSIKLYRENGCFVEEKSKWNNCFYVFDGKGNKIHEGLLIAMNADLVAIFKKDGSYVFKREDGFVLQRKLQ